MHTMKYLIIFFNLTLLSCAGVKSVTAKRTPSSFQQNVVMDIFCIDTKSLEEGSYDTKGPYSAVALKSYEGSSLVFFNGKMYQEEGPFRAATEGLDPYMQVASENYNITVFGKNFTTLFDERGRKVDAEVRANIQNLKTNKSYNAFCYGLISFKDSNKKNKVL